jgi:hypothetical protein
VGIFYVIEGELWIESMPLPEARHLREVSIRSRRHRWYWKMFGQVIPAIQGVPQRREHSVTKTIQFS